MGELEKLIESIKKHEGLRLKVYTCPAGKQTIGYGRNLEDNGISEKEANMFLDEDIFHISFELRHKLFNEGIMLFTLPSHVKNVLIEMAYQIGLNGLLKFKKTLEYIRNTDYEKASKEMLNSKWAKQTPNRAKALSNLMKGGY